jgi:predicted DNA-binding transcriptional regulator YafY
MYSPTTRLLTILELLQARGEMTGKELAEILEVEERSIRRYILMLRDLGIPIDGERGRHGGYALQPGYRLPPMMFTAEELTAIMTGLMLTRASGLITGFATESATAKIERVLPPELHQRAQALQASLFLDKIQGRVRGVSNEWLSVVSLAVYECRSLEITYRSAEGIETSRVIDPYGLVLHANVYYVPGYCHLREAFRLFRLDRVRAISTIPQSFTRSISINPRDFVIHALSQLPGTFIFKVLVHAPLVVVQECVPVDAAILERVGEKTLMQCYSDDPQWMAQYLATLELPFTVLETEELRSALHELAQTLQTAIL